MTDATQQATTTTPTETAQTQQAAQTQVSDATQAAATAKKTEGEQLLFEQKQQGEQGKEGADKPKDGDGKDGKDADKKDAGKDAAVTVDQLTFPEEQPLPEDMKADVNAFMAKHKISKDAAQEMVAMQVKMNEKNLDHWIETKANWRKECEADPTYGGKNLDKSVADANSIVRQFGDDALIQDLKLLGLGNKLSFLRFCNKIRASVAEDSIAGTGAQGGDNKSLEARLWPNAK